MENQALNIGVKLYKKVAMPLYRTFDNEELADKFIDDLGSKFACSKRKYTDRRKRTTYTVGYVEANALYADKLEGKIVRPQLGVVYAR